MSLIAISKIEQALANAKTPVETKQLEAVSQAARAWAKENDDYETYIKATRVYIMSRRKTTELIQPNIKHGGNNVVTLQDYGFTKMQWHRRMQELEIPITKVDEYFDECIAKKWDASPFGLSRFTQESTPPVTHADWCDSKKECNCGVIENKKGLK